MTGTEKAEAVREHERMTTGSDSFYKHFLGLTYTDGIAFVAETCGAHWLIDIVASYQPKLRREEFQVWRLRHMDSGAWAIECFPDTPSEGNRLVYQRIESSDFPEELSPFMCWVEHGTMLLPREH